MNIYVHPGTVKEARQWAKQNGVHRNRVISARQASSNHLHGCPLVAVLVSPPVSDDGPGLSNLEQVVKEHNHVLATATLTAWAAELGYTVAPWQLKFATAALTARAAS